MVFSSLIFLFFFLPLFLFIYYLAPFKFKNLVLLIFSLIFYSFGEPKYIFLLLFISIVNYVFGLIFEKVINKRNRKILLILDIIINLGVLVFFKYLNFFIDIFNCFGNSISFFDIALPLGISFFTFQTMSYSIDVYKKDVDVSHDFISFMTYVSMFPQLIAGPIVRYQDVEVSLKRRSIKFVNYYTGMFKFLCGLFKKVLLANNLGFLFTLISGDINNMSLLTAWLGIIAFSLQIYFDFSGYSDMAIGMGTMLGFNYPNNFNYPYISISITDFWRRWHMTLSTFFRDYVYIPLGGNRCSKFRHIFNLLVVWFLTGMWHGASWNFILWGLYFGIILILEKYLLFNILNKIPLFFSHIYSLFLILIGWLIFAFDDISSLFIYSKKMFANKLIVDNVFKFYISNYFIFLIFGILLSTPILSKVKINKFVIVFMFLIFFVITIASLVSDTYNPFLYFRF